MTPSPPSLEAMQVLIARLADDFKEMKDLQAQMAQGLQTLIRLDTEHQQTARALGRAFDQIKELERRHADLDGQVPERLAERLRTLEDRAPINNLTSGWVLKLVLAGAVAYAAFMAGAATERHIEAPAAVGR